MINNDTLSDYIARIGEGDRVALAQAMTLVESRHPRHQALSARLLDAIMPGTGKAIRLGVTGTPGAGKSTFLEALGMLLIGLGHRVAVIAVDPSSPVSGGSILGDKTRMSTLSRTDRAFIRPVPSGGYLGGASQRARELILLCEAAGYDVVIVETVGVGQSETDVARMVDCFISLQIAGGGDELQGIKKGIMEMADLIVINKDDGDNRASVAATRQMYDGALHIMRRKYPQWQPQVLSCSAMEKRGIDAVWQTISTFHTTLLQSGELAALRKRQAVEWLHRQTEDALLRLVFTQPDFAEVYRQTENAVAQTQLSARAGMAQIQQFIQHRFLI